MCNILLLNLRKFSSFKFMDQGRSGVKYGRDFQTLNVKKSVLTFTPMRKVPLIMLTGFSKKFNHYIDDHSRATTCTMQITT